MYRYPYPGTISDHVCCAAPRTHNSSASRVLVPPGMLRLAVFSFVVSSLVAAFFMWRRRLLASIDSPWIAAVRRMLDEPPPGPIDLPVKIQPALFLGDKRSANNPQILEAFGITHVLNVAGKYGATTHAGVHHKHIHAEDEEGYPILSKHLGEASAFIHQARDEGGCCLIHCQAGINRSGCIAVAELMLSEHLPVLDAIARVKKARGVLLTNHSFQEQLVALARANGLLGTQPENLGPLPPARKQRRPAADALRRLG